MSLCPWLHKLHKNCSQSAPWLYQVHKKMCQETLGCINCTKCANTPLFTLKSYVKRGAAAAATTRAPSLLPPKRAAGGRGERTASRRGDSLSPSPRRCNSPPPSPLAKQETPRRGHSLSAPPNLGCTSAAAIFLARRRRPTRRRPRLRRHVLRRRRRPSSSHACYCW